LAIATAALAAAPFSDAFVPQNVAFQTKVNAETAFTTTSLNAIGVLARKAKEAELRTYVEGGVEENVLEKFKEMKSAAESVELDNTPGPLQELLTKRKGTITIIAEYKRKLENTAFIDEVFDPEILSPSFREYGASAIAVLADERMGGCTYDDIADFVEEQRRAKMEVPGPLMVISNDLVVDELQIARSAAYGASAVTLNYALLGDEKALEFMKYAKAIGMESIVGVADQKEAQSAINAGARIINIVGVPNLDDKVAAITDLEIPEGAKVCTVATIIGRDDKEFGEIEEAWQCRDKGFNSIWVNDALYKSGNSAVEHPGAVISAMKAKSSVKWASPKARSGKGEGAREYLGDILM